MPRIAVPTSLAPKADIRFGLPNLTDPKSLLTLEVRFRIHPSSLSPRIAVTCPGLVLKVWRPPRGWSPAQHRRRHRLVLQVPAALFIMRRITQLCVRTGAKTEIASLSVRWQDPASLRERVVGLLTRVKRRMLALRL
jgi:hypothetical protein